MSKRKGLSKSVRFEVFKRDGFTCQYCGGQAPDVILHVDHINPVANGGENDILNLITACKDCNSGKGAKTLDDNSTIAKQRAQLEELNERRQQLEMMLEWRQALANLDQDYVVALERHFEALTRCTLSEFGRKEMARHLKRFSVSELLEALDASVETYFRGGSDDDEENIKLGSQALKMLPRVANARRLNDTKPWMNDLFYIRAIIRNRMYCNERVALDLLERAYHAGADLAELQDWAKRARNWTNWRNEMEEWVDELEAQQ